MGIERRGDRTYYYRTRRVNGRVVREYLGADEAGETAAKHDQEARREAAEAAAQRAEVERAERAELKRIGATLDLLRVVIDVLIESQMIAAGLPHARRDELPGCGHYPQYTHPGAMAGAIQTFATPVT